MISIPLYMCFCTITSNGHTSLNTALVMRYITTVSHLKWHRYIINSSSSLFISAGHLTFSRSFVFHLEVEYGCH